MNIVAPTFLIGSFSSFFQVTKTTLKSGQSSNLRQIRPRAAELAALDRIEKFPYTYNGRNLVNTLAPSFLAHLSRRLIGELLVYRGIRRPSVRRQHFQTTSSLKPLGRFLSYFIYSIYR